MPNANEADGVPVEVLAKAILFVIEGEGYFFVTHEGDMVGPTKNKEDAITKATLYLTSYKGMQV